jgi:hypothetical protein
MVVAWNRDHRKTDLCWPYEGLDQRLVATRIMFDPKPSRSDQVFVSCQVHLEPGENANYQWTIACEVDGDSQGENESYEKIMHDATAALERTRAREPQIFADNEQFNDWLEPFAGRSSL